jgi:beta-xylosidase
MIAPAKRILAMLLLFLGTFMTDARGQSSIENYPWTPDLGDGTFRNPILFADYSDPDVVRVGDDFWLTASSFNCTPGLPILHSKDLVNWKIVNYALKHVSGEQYDKPLHGCGVWAPAIRYHDSKFWIFFPTPDEGIYVITARDPAGQWSQPHLLIPGKGFIDPCPLWDDDGKAYIVYAFAGSRTGGYKDRLHVREMSPDGMKVLSEGKVVFHKPDPHRTLEGPKFLKKDGWYYILAPAGGVAQGWQVVLRSRDIYGPYEDKIVLAQGSTPINGPHQGALLDLQGGEWWFIHFQERQPYGRITHLQPVTWKDGWPLMGINQNDEGVGEPVLTFRKPNVGAVYKSEIPQTSDDFDHPKLGLQWQWHANYRDHWSSLTARPGWMRLNTQFVEGGDFSKAPSLLMQKPPAPSFTINTLMEASLKDGEEAGLIVMGKEHAALLLRQTKDSRHIVYRVNNKDVFIGAWPGGTVHLQMSMQSGGICTFSYSDDGKTLRKVGPSFQAVEGRWIGAKVGVFSMSSTQSNSPGYADFDYFRFSALP